jgi:branched-chain amino acid aminotransferase
VLEAPTSSVFWVDAQGRLATPPLDDHVLASITRDLVMEVVWVEERPLVTDELLLAREVFLASTTREVQAVAGVEDRDFGPPGPRTREAAAAVRSAIEAALNDDATR